MGPDTIQQTVARILNTFPEGVLLVAAAKTRTPEEAAEAIDAGVTAIGHNYVQEAEQMIRVLGDRAKWHLIGHLQRNKVKKAIELFDMIESLDSWELAERIDRRCEAVGRVMSVLVEVNSGREPAKTGILPEEVDGLVRKLADLRHLRVQGLMTMGPRFGDPEEARAYFRETKAAFDRLTTADLPNVEMRYLSMGMSNSYDVAIEEGANIVRIGTKLFGERDPG